MARSKPSDTATASIDEVAEELYGLPLDEFTEVRNERAKSAREAGDRDAAEAIRKLGKPNTVAWLANQLVRRHHDEIAPLLELGASLREATASLDADSLRALSRQQHQVIYALVQQARGLAADVGQSVTETTARGLEDTLHAALADERAAAALAGGRLTTGLTAGGFPGIDAPPPPVRTAPGASRAAGRTAAAKPDVDELARRRLQRARDDEADARAAAKQADAERATAQQRLDEAAQAARAAAEQVSQLQAQLDKAAAARDEADRAERQARKDADRAEQAARRAARRLEDAVDRRTQLES